MEADRRQRERTVLIADNHPLFRAGVRSTVEDLPDFSVVGEVSDGVACVTQAALFKPDFVTVDLNMPGMDGFEVALRLRDQGSGCLVIVVSMYADKAYVEKAMECGAHGFVAKEDAGTELGMAFVQAGSGFFMSSSVGKPEPLLTVASDTGEGIAQMLERLTPAERRVLRLVSRSLASRTIADELGVSERTVHTHRNNICAKIGVHGANALLTFALSNRDEIARLCGDPGSRI
ncbi:response regulator [Oricola cellulosilytica]|nr:response regulator transcription factor [Oricola cellulosilytica]